MKLLKELQPLPLEDLYINSLRIIMNPVLIEREGGPYLVHWRDLAGDLKNRLLVENGPEALVSECVEGIEAPDFEEIEIWYRPVAT